MSIIIQILEYIIDSFIHIWPYLLITIPIAVAVQMSGAAKYINRAFSAKPVIAILLATAVGAFSPLCSCSVIPVVAAMLIGGVPLAPVMSFWLASPSMDPEIFFLTVGFLGWQLAIWRLGSTLFLSLAGGFVTHLIVQHGWLGENILRGKNTDNNGRILPEIMAGARKIRQRMADLWSPRFGIVPHTSMAVEVAACPDPINQPDVIPLFMGGFADSQKLTNVPTDASTCETSCSDTTCGVETGSDISFWQRLIRETWSATSMVIKFMLLAWLVGALVKIYVPQELISGILSAENPWAILTAALLGVPVYTSNLAAMPLVGGLLDLGMHPAAALAFLIAGPMTTLPAMSAVWGLVNRKVFAMYIGFALVGAVVFGYIFQLFLHF